MEMDLLALYRAACASQTAETGYYNRNVRLHLASIPVMVRIPIPGADNPDLRIWPEHQTLQGLIGWIELSRVPRLLHASDSPAFQIYEYVSGKRLDEVAPRGAAVPAFVLRDVVILLDELIRVPREAFPSIPVGWPADGDTTAFAHRVCGLTASFATTRQDQDPALFRRLGIPREPLASTVERLPSMRSRLFGLLHCDLHRKNMVVNQGHVVFLDWELALWGDPVYDLAVHLYKMGYQPNEQAVVITGWLKGLPSVCTHGWEHDLKIYLDHECVKTALVDAVRYRNFIVASALTPDQERSRITRLTVELNAAGAVWGWQRTLTKEEVEAALHQPAT